MPTKEEAKKDALRLVGDDDDSETMRGRNLVVSRQPVACHRSAPRPFNEEISLSDSHPVDKRCLF